jgi:hypothetical protein
MLAFSRNVRVAESFTKPEIWMPGVVPVPGDFVAPGGFATPGDFVAPGDWLHAKAAMNKDVIKNKVRIITRNIFGKSEAAR